MEEEVDEAIDEGVELQPAGKRRRRSVAPVKTQEERAPLTQLAQFNSVAALKQQVIGPSPPASFMQTCTHVPSLRSIA